MARVVFFGSPDFALPSLKILLTTDYRPILVVTQPDRPSGRGRKLLPTPVRRLAEDSGIPVKIVSSFKNGEAVDELRSLGADFFVVVAFGLIFPPRLLEVAVKANINVHASLLPSYRGASPVNMAIVNGESFTGTTTMEMAESLDSGPIYLQRVMPIDPMESAGELSERLSRQGASLLLDTLKGIDSGELESVDQPAEGASTARRLKKRNGLIPWEMDALSVHNHIRGMNPWPGSYTYYGGSYIKVHGAEPYDLVRRSRPPGFILEAAEEGILVACAQGAVRLKRLQCEGKRPLDANDFLRGFEIVAGEVMGAED